MRYARTICSAHAFHCVLKLNDSIADFADAEQIAALRIAEALLYRLQMDAK